MNATQRERKYFARQKMVKIYVRLIRAGFLGKVPASVVVNWNTVKNGQGRLSAMIKDLMNQRRKPNPPHG